MQSIFDRIVYFFSDQIPKSVSSKACARDIHANLTQIKERWTSLNLTDLTPFSFLKIKAEIFVVNCVVQSRGHFRQSEIEPSILVTTLWIPGGSCVNLSPGNGISTVARGGDDVCRDCHVGETEQWGNTFIGTAELRVWVHRVFELFKMLELTGVKVPEIRLWAISALTQYKIKTVKEAYTQDT